MKTNLLKTFIKMSRYAIFCIVLQSSLYSFAIAHSSKGQDKMLSEIKLNIEFENSTLQDAFRKIEQNTDFTFAYLPGDLPKEEISLSLSDRSRSLKEILIEVGKQAGVSFLRVSETIHVKKDTKRYSTVKEVVQTIEVVGTVTSDDGEPLPGVNVLVKNTNYGTVTDINGKYTIEAEDDAVLVFSFIGYSAQEVPINGRSVIDVTLHADITQLTEVVVVGYGTQKKENLTGSISQIASEEIKMRSVNNTTQALQGLAPNLNVDVNSSGGSADASMSINVRGTGSLSSSDPYILIDGVRATASELSALNPDVIQSISVLKDAAASAIYGAQAAYGVILIETKKGGDEKFTLNYTSDYRVKKRIFVPPSVNSIEYARVLNDASRNYSGQIAIGEEQMAKIIAYSNGEIDYQTEQDPNSPNEWLGIQKGTSNGWFTGFANTDWWDVMYKDYGFSKKHNLSASGGNDKLSFHISGGYFNDGGQLAYGDENENFDRYTLNTNITANVTDWLKISNYTRYYQENNIFPATLEGGSRGRLFHDIMRFSPLAPYKTPAVKDAEGNIIVPEQLALMPGWSENNGFNAYNDNNLVSTLKAEVELSKDLSISGDFTFKRNFYDRTLNLKKWALIGPDAKPSVTYQVNNNQIAKDIRKTNYTTFNIYGRYKKSIANKHNFEGLLGYQQEQSDYFRLDVSRRDVIADDLNSLNVAIGDVIGPGNDMNNWATLGAFGRLKYNYDNKYLLEFNGRYDGSSRFAKGKRFGFYPSLSAGYNLHKEDYWSSVSDYVNTMKIRVSWGKLGNQDVGNYLYLSNIPIRDRLAWVIGGERPNYSGMPDIISPDITWETAVTKNLGVELSFLKSRLSTSFDIYERQTDNMFGPSGALPAVLGTNPPRTNSASLETKGWEFTLGWTEQVNDLRYDLRLFLSDNRTFITEYHNPEKVLNSYYVGQELGEIWGYEADELFQSQPEVDQYTSEVDLTHLGTNWQAGNVKYKDLNGDGKVNVGSNTLNDPGDRRVIGNSNSRYRISVQGGIFWRNFDFNMFWQGVGKRDFVMDPYATLFWGWNSRGHTRITEASLDYWSEDNPGAYLPIQLENGGRGGFGKDRHASTRYIQDASYIRLKNLSLGYTVPAGLTERLKVTKLRVYMSGENLLTFTKMWENFDPELVTTGTRRRTSVGRAYPLAQVYTVGVDITF
jgi:TonB-linked SusC/RagA family outer membrane protein